MKNILKKVFKNKTLALFLAFFILTFPTAIYQKSEFEKRAILTSIGIDKNGENYEFSGLMVVEENPSQISSNVKLISSEGKNIAEAVYKMSITLGKEIGLAHCDSIVVGEGLKDENLVEVLDYFVRSSNLTKNTNLIHCPGQAKELLEVNTANKDENGITFSKLVSTGSDYLAVVDMNIEDFYARYFTKSPTAWMTIVQIDEEGGEQSGSSESGGGEQSGSSGSGGGESGSGNSGTGSESSGASGSGGSQSSGQNKKIKSEGNFAVYNKGRLAFILEGDEANIMNILNPYTEKGFLTVDNVFDEGIEKKSMGIRVIKKKTKLKYYFDDDGTACVDINFKAYVELVELKTPSASLKTIDVTTTHIGENVKKAINEKFQSNIEKVLEKVRETKTDLFALNDRLYKFKTKDYKKYISKDEQQNNFIENAKVNLKVDIEAKL